MSIPPFTASAPSPMIGGEQPAAATLKSNDAGHDFDHHLGAAKRADRAGADDDASTTRADDTREQTSSAGAGQDDAKGKAKPARSAAAAPPLTTPAAVPAMVPDTTLATTMLGLLGQRAGTDTPTGAASTAPSPVALGGVTTTTAPNLAPTALAIDGDDEEAAGADNDASDQGEALLSAIQSSEFMLATGVADEGGDAPSPKPAPTPAAADSPPQALQGLAPIVGAPVPSTIAGNTHRLVLANPTGSSAFAQELGQQVTWLSTQDIKEANIRLHPQELGQLEVKISLSHGRVDVAFAAQHPAAVHAVQQSLGQLDQLLGAQGLSLGQTSVGQQTSQQPFGASGQGATGGADPIRIEDNEAPAVTSAAVSSHLGLVDAFA